LYSSGEVAEFFGDAVGWNAVGAHLRDDFAQPSAVTANGFARGSGLPPVGDPRAATVSQIEPTFGRQLAVGFGHGVEVQAEVDGSAADRGKFVAGPKPTFDKLDPQGVGDLTGGRNGGV
jgi:hypothetical protein